MTRLVDVLGDRRVQLDKLGLAGWSLRLPRGSRRLGESRWLAQRIDGFSLYLQQPDDPADLPIYRGEIALGKHDVSVGVVEGATLLDAMKTVDARWPMESWRQSTHDAEERWQAEEKHQQAEEEGEPCEEEEPG